MEIDGRIIRQMILSALIVLIVPMILFPILLGTEFMKSSLMNVSFAFGLFEFVFYGFCIYFFNRETNLLKLMGNAAICLVGRYVLGAVLGLLISAMYAMNIGIALKFGAISFWPSVAIHVLSVPFILKPLFSLHGDNQATAQKTAKSRANLPNSESSTPIVASKSVPPKERPNLQADYSNFTAHKTPTKTAPTNPNTEDGFDKAVKYIGENGSTLMAAIIDNEGLLLSSYQRAMYEAEDVAPFVLSILANNKNTLEKMQFSTPEKTNILFENQRLIIASEKYYTLVVIAERTVDDVLNIRINQALEMIRIYTAERYSEELIGNAERIYV